jgi:uncharacterized membrane protein YkoI
VKQFLKKKWVVPVGALVLTLAIGSAAFAATGTTSTSTSGTDSSVSSGQTDATELKGGPHGFGAGGQRSDETPLTGDTLTQAQAAAMAAVGSDATVIRAETDADGNAKYEVHMKKADGTAVTVYLDEGFAVVKTEEGPAGGNGGNGYAGGQRSDETPLTGDTLAQAQSAALAASEVGTGATVMRAETDSDGNGAYEVHVKKADGTMVTVYLNSSFKVVSVTEAQMGGGRHGGGERQRDGDCNGTGTPQNDSNATTTDVIS